MSSAALLLLVPLGTIYLTLTAAPLVVVEGSHVVGHDRVAVLVLMCSRLAHELNAGEVLHVECERQERVAQRAVDGGELLQVCEVEVYVLAVVLAADAPFE